MSQEKPQRTTEPTADNSTTDSAIVRAMSSMRGHSAYALLGSIHEVAEREYGFRGTLERALSMVSDLPGVRVEQDSPLEQTRVFSDHWKHSYLD